MAAGPLITGAVFFVGAVFTTGGDAFFLGAFFFGAAFLGAAFFGTNFFGAAFFGAAFFGVNFFGAAFFGAAFFVAAFFGADFFFKLEDEDFFFEFFDLCARRIDLWTRACGCRLVAASSVVENFTADQTTVWLAGFVSDRPGVGSHTKSAAKAAPTNIITRSGHDVERLAPHTPLCARCFGTRLRSLQQHIRSGQMVSLPAHAPLRLHAPD